MRWVRWLADKLSERLREGTAKREGVLQLPYASSEDAHQYGI